MFTTGSFMRALRDRMICRAMHYMLVVCRMYVSEARQPPIQEMSLNRHIPSLSPSCGLALLKKQESQSQRCSTEFIKTARGSRG